MILSIWLWVKSGKKCFLRFLDLFVFGLCLTCLTYALDITSTTDFFKETGNLIRQVIRSDKNWWFSQFFSHRSNRSNQILPPCYTDISVTLCNTELIPLAGSRWVPRLRKTRTGSFWKLGSWKVFGRGSQKRKSQCNFGNFGKAGNERRPECSNLGPHALAAPLCSTCLAAWWATNSTSVTVR